MRFLAKVTIPMEKGDQALDSSALRGTMQSAMERLNPESAYFSEEDGTRECFFVFNLDVGSLVKQLFPNLDASFHVTPVMNATEFQQGLGPAKRGQPFVEEPDFLADISPAASGAPGSQPAHGRWADAVPHPSIADDELAKKR